MNLLILTQWEAEKSYNEPMKHVFLRTVRFEELVRVKFNCSEKILELKELKITKLPGHERNKRKESVKI